MRYIEIGFGDTGGVSSQSALHDKGGFEDGVEMGDLLAIVAFVADHIGDALQIALFAHHIAVLQQILTVLAQQLLLLLIPTQGIFHQ